MTLTIPKINKILKILENIALGLFVNGIYSIIVGNINLANLIIVIGSIYILAITIFFGD
ncbi:MAG: hypothetical protein ABGX23_05940 [Nautiliaceae bacterium]|jgi:hypothetical protein